MYAHLSNKTSCQDVKCFEHCFMIDLKYHLWKKPFLTLLCKVVSHPDYNHALFPDQANNMVKCMWEKKVEL